MYCRLTAAVGHADYGAFNLNTTITSTGTSTISTSNPTDGTMMLNSSGANGLDTPRVFGVQSGTLTVSAPRAEVPIESKISDLTKSGTGTPVLYGANTHTGAATISGGTLGAIVGGSCSHSAVTVNAAAGCTLGVFVNDDTLMNADTTVTLNTTVKPGSVTVSNSTCNYVITRSGAISGSTGLTKSGSKTLTLGTMNYRAPHGVPIVPFRPEPRSCDHGAALGLADGHYCGDGGGDQGGVGTSRCLWRVPGEPADLEEREDAVR